MYEGVLSKTLQVPEELSLRSLAFCCLLRPDEGGGGGPQQLVHTAGNCVEMMKPTLFFCARITANIFHCSRYPTAFRMAGLLWLIMVDMDPAEASSRGVLGVLIRQQPESPEEQYDRLVSRGNPVVLSSQSYGIVNRQSGVGT